jgi:glycosyltransferase involved in cell wall biosynthesis
LNSKNIVTVTDMTEIGEVLSLLRAFHTLVVKKPASRLIIVGNGPLFKDIEFETLNLVLGSKVIFTGAVSNEDLPDYINLGDVYVNLSSRTSGFEPSMLEAMALEKVVVGSEISPISTIIEDGVDGFLIRPADESTLVKRLTEMFTETVPSREMGAKAREKVLDLFNLDKMVDQLLAGFKKTLQHTNRRPRPADILLRQPASEAAFSQQSPF